MYNPSDAKMDTLLEAEALHGFFVKKMTACGTELSKNLYILFESVM